MKFLKWSLLGVFISVLISIITFFLVQNDTATHGNPEGLAGVGYLIFNFFAWISIIVVCMVIGYYKEQKANLKQAKKPITIPTRWIYFLIILGLILLYFCIRYISYG